MIGEAGDDALCNGALGWNWSYVEPPPRTLTASAPAAQVPGGCSCGNGDTRGDLLSSMVAAVVAAVV